MSADYLLAWWNLVFIVPFLLAVLYLAVYAVSGVTFGEGEMELAGDFHADIDADTDIDADADADLDHDLDGDVDHDLEAGAEHELNGEAHAAAESNGEAQAGGGSAPAGSARELPFHLGVMSWLGLGRVPLSILLMVLLITWGVIGFIANVILSPIMPWPWMAVLGSLPAAALGSAFITRSVVRLVGHWMPTMETYARRTGELVGSAGEATYDIDHQFGVAHVRDSRGDLFQVPCRVYPDDKPIQKGSKVLLVDYDDDQKMFFVTPYDVMECTRHPPP
jgi:membrane protein implicated in regulation of membrane protease activity